MADRNAVVRAGESDHRPCVDRDDISTIIKHRTPACSAGCLRIVNDPAGHNIADMALGGEWPDDTPVGKVLYEDQEVAVGLLN